MGKRTVKLTNEGLGADRFESLFDLVNYAIGVAQDKIKSGRDTRVSTDIRNTAYQVLREIDEGKDLLEPVEEEYHVEDDGEAVEEVIEDEIVDEVEESEAEEAESAV